MIRIIYRDETGSIRMDMTSADLPELRRINKGTLWVDMLAPEHDEHLAVLEEIFQFHPLAVEDAIADAHLPKLDDYGQYLYWSWHRCSWALSQWTFVQK